MARMFSQPGTIVPRVLKFFFRVGSCYIFTIFDQSWKKKDRKVLLKLLLMRAKNVKDRQDSFLWVKKLSTDLSSTSRVCHVDFSYIYKRVALQSIVSCSLDIHLPDYLSIQYESFYWHIFLTF